MQRRLKCRMKNLRLKFIAALVYLASHGGIVGAVDSTPCPGHEALVISDNVRAACTLNMPESKVECKKLITELSNVESPTTQQKYDLAAAMYDLADFSVHSESDELRNRGDTLLRSLHEEHPTDTTLLWKLHLYADENKSIDFLRRILQVAPNCSKVRNYLLVDLGFTTSFLDDPQIREDTRAEISHHIDAGYDLATEKMWKIRFGSMSFESLLDAGHMERARRLHERLFTELDIENLTYDDASRVDNLEAICDYSAFALRFTEYCLDAIEQSLAIDVAQGGPLGDDVLLAIKALGLALTLTDPGSSLEKFNHPAIENEYDFGSFPFFPQEAVVYAIRLGDMILGVPIALHTLELHRANYIHSDNTQRQILQEMLKVRPDDEEIQDAVASYR